MSAFSEDKGFSSKNISKVIAFVLLVALIIIIYSRVGTSEFITFDDDTYVYNCPQVQDGLTFQNIIWSFTNIHSYNYHPLTSISLFIDSSLFGIRPGPFHLVNLFFHICNTLLLLATLFMMTKCFWKSAFVAALFALHPIHVESVAWISERKDVLCTFFWLLTMISYVWYVTSPKVGRYITVLIFMVLSLLAKPMAVTLPFVLLLLDVWPLGRMKLAEASDGEHNPWGLIHEKLPMFAAIVIISFVTFFVQRYSGLVMTVDLFSLDERISNALVSYIVYLKNMLWPFHLAIFYPHPRAVLWVPMAFSIIFLLSVSVLTLRYLRSKPYLAVGWFWYLGTLVPVIGIVQVGLQALADRYSYIPLIGIFIIIAWGAQDLFMKFRLRKTVLVAGVFVSLILCSVMSWYQVGYWKDSPTIYTHTIEATSQNYWAYYYLGDYFLKESRIDDAITNFQNCVQIEPEFIPAHFYLGAIYMSRGDFSNTLKQLKIVLMQPDLYNVEAHAILGTAFMRLNRLDEALKHFSMARDMMPTSNRIVDSYNSVVARISLIRSAIGNIQEQLKASPHDVNVLYKLATLNSSIGQYSEAEKYLQMIAEIEPKNPDVYYNLACISSRQNKVDEAVRQMRKSIELGFHNWDKIKRDPDLDNIRAALTLPN
jgi:protein O-mannosyl-transferase